MNLPPNPRRIPALDAFRGIAIALVLVHHAGRLPWGGPSMVYVTAIGGAGVDLFFVLSGFLITGILLDLDEVPRRWTRFYARRARRILPLYFVALALLVWVVPLTALGRRISGALPEDQAWFWLHASNIYFVGHEFESALTVAHLWSLAVEEQFYLVWPAVVWWAGARRLPLVCVGLVVAALALRVGLTIADLPGAYTLTPARMDGLAAGSFVAVWARREGGAAQLRSHAHRVLLFAAPFALLWPFPVAGITLGYTGMALASAAGLALAVLSPQSGWATWLTNRSWLQRLGVISYGVYVVHLPITAALRASGLLPAGLLFLATVSLVSVAVAALSWHYLESPFLRAPRASGIGSTGTRVATHAGQSPVASPREAPSVVLPELASHPVLDAEKQ